MKSPFPGMDPYLEARWSDVRLSLLAFLGEALQALLPSDLRARCEQRLVADRDGRSSLAAWRSERVVVRRPRPMVEHKGPAAPAPFLVDLLPRVPTDRFVHVIDVTREGRVVTAIEVLTPWNKVPGRLNRDYRRRLAGYARAGVSVVEIDLLRSPRHRLPVGQQDLPADRRTPYLVCVRRGWRPSRWELYPIGLRPPLPPLPVPLRKNEPQVTADLQPLIDRVYVAGGHDDIDYRVPPEPPLEGEDAAWAESLLKEAGRR